MQNEERRMMTDERWAEGIHGSSFCVHHLLALYDREMRLEVEFFDTRREAAPRWGRGTPHVVRHVSLSGPEGAVLYARFDPARTDEVIRAQVARFEHIGQGFEWKTFAHDEQPGLKEHLQAHGFTIEEVEAILVLDVAQAPAALLEPVRHDLRRLGDPGALDDLVVIEQRVWNEDFTQLVRTLGDELRHDRDRISIYAAYVEGQPAGCAWIRFHRGSHFASLWGGATLPQYRGRGLYKALVAARLQEALARGVSYLTVDASPMSAPILRRHGFRQITTCTPCKWRVPNP